MFRIHSFEDFCLWMYVMIDDWYQQRQAGSKRPGPEPSSCSDSELLTMVLVGECSGWQQESELFSHWKERGDLFPELPCLNRFNRRRRELVEDLQGLHQFMLRQMRWAEERLVILDSVPIAVVSYAHAAHASSDWRVHQASYGYSHTKRLPFYGYYLHLLMTVNGVLLDWSLTSASTSDVAAGEDLLCHTPISLTQRLILADKGYPSRALRRTIQRERQAYLLVLPKRGMRAAARLPVAIRRRFSSLRQRIETVNSQLAQQLGVEQTSAHSFEGFCARLRAKLTAHVCCVYANWCLGVPVDDALQIKHLVFAG